MRAIGIITPNGLEEIALDNTTPKLIFGLKKNAGKLSKPERKAIGHALKKTGFDVYATQENWPNDAYVERNGLYIPNRYFEGLGKGGNYVFGDGFVLASESIREEIEKKLRDDERFRRFFSDAEILYAPNRPFNFGDNVFDLSHIDLTVGYVPSGNALFVEVDYYAQNETLFRGIRERHGVNVNAVKCLDGLFPNNFLVIQYNGKSIVIANQNNPLCSTNTGAEVIGTDRFIEEIPFRYGGSVKCATNYSPTTKLWDALGIEYRRWGIRQEAE